MPTRWGGGAFNEKNAGFFLCTETLINEINCSCDLFFSFLIYIFVGGDMARAPEQWRIILVGGLAGLLGSIIDSLLGKMFLWFLIRRGEISQIKMFNPNM